MTLRTVGTVTIVKVGHCRRRCSVNRAIHSRRVEPVFPAGWVNSSQNTDRILSRISNRSDFYATTHPTMAPPLVVLVAAAEMLSLGAQDGLPIRKLSFVFRRILWSSRNGHRSNISCSVECQSDSEDAKDALQWKPLPILSSLTTAYTGPQNRARAVWNVVRPVVTGRHRRPAMNART